MHRVPGGEKNKKSGERWTEDELLQIYFLYKKLDGEGLHERNPDIIEAAKMLGRTIRSTEAQTLMFRNLDRGGDYSHGNMNKLCRKIWLEQEGEYVAKETEIDNGKNKHVKNNQEISFPSGLLEWAGSGSGGVKKPFDNNSGRPTGEHIKTSLTHKIDEWVEGLSSQSPRVILLVGGPGNGKTDSLEYLIKSFDERFQTEFYEEITTKNRSSGDTPPRSIEVAINMQSIPFKKIKIVQDATPGENDLSSEQCLINDFQEAFEKEIIYIACINRGILAEAVRLAETNNREIYEVMKTIISGLTDTLNLIPLWPLKIDGKLKNKLAVWPMDVESLVERNRIHGSPAEKIFQSALNEEKWKCGECTVNKDFCPFYQNRIFLNKPDNLTGLLRVLRDFELMSNKRWTFRDLYALVPYLIVGSREEFGTQDPCKWVEAQTKVLNKSQIKDRTGAIWRLNEHLYHSKLFSRWPPFHSIIRSKKNKDLIQVFTHSESTKSLFSYFSYVRPKKVNKPVIGTFLDEQFSPLMDPGQLSNIDDDFGKLLDNVKNIESSFSYSVKVGYELVIEALNPIENELFRQLIQIENELDQQVRELNSSNPQIDKLLSIIRMIAVRYFKRTYFTSQGLSKDEIYLQEYRQLTPEYDKDKSRLKGAKELFDSLIQNKDDMSLILNSSISQPAMSFESQIKLSVVRVTLDHKYIINEINDVPRSNTIIFQIIFGRKEIPVPLTYELYKALAQLREGLRASSLPTEILAMLDNIKSKLAGITVRGGLEILRNAKIQIGNSEYYYRVDDPRAEFEITKQTYN